MADPFGLTSPLVRDLADLGSIALPLVAGGVVWRRLPGRRRARRVAASVVVVAACAAAQLLAVLAVGISVNDSYGFYASYGDLAGTHGRQAPIAANTIGAADGGHVEALTVHGRSSHTTAQVLVWLPPQYNLPQYVHHRFPVVEFLPGQPAQPGQTFEQFGLAAAASQVIGSGEAPPFVVVVPPLMIRPPWDTECTDVPGGPKALSWLTRDVPAALRHDLRVRPPGRHWSVMGFSTGGFCAAKLVLDQPSRYAAAVGLGGYYQPTTVRTYPRLFGGNLRLRLANSPQTLYHRNGLHGDHLLIVAGREDVESYRSTHRMLLTTAADPDVDYALFPDGGHNIGDYGRYVVPALRWLGRVGAI